MMALVRLFVFLTFALPIVSAQTCSSLGESCFNSTCCKNVQIRCFNKEKCLMYARATGCQNNIDCSTNRCVEVNGVNKCVYCSQLEQSCGSDADCCRARTCFKGLCLLDSGSMCSTNTNCVSGMCGPDKRCTQFGAGIQCENNLDCTSSNCTDDGVCECSTTGLDPCASSTDCCDNAQSCTDFLGGAVCGKCKTAGAKCASTKECCLGKCDAIGRKCRCEARYQRCISNEDCCSDGVCDNKTRTCRPVPIGGPCQSDGVCITGICTDKKCDCVGFGGQCSTSDACCRKKCSEFNSNGKGVCVV